MKYTLQQRTYDVTDYNHVDRDANKFIKSIIDNQHLVVKHPWIDGFYSIPGLSNYLISRDGRLYSTAANKVRTQNSGGNKYITYNIKTSDYGEICIMMNRLVAACFLPKPDMSLEYLQVNHKNGNKYDNSVENLEWTTPSENVVHSIQHYLNDHLPRPVERRDANTGKVDIFLSIKKAAQHCKLTPDAIRNRANSMGEKRFDGNYQWRWHSPDEPEWPVVNDRDYSKRGRPVLLYDLLRHVQFEFDGANEVCRLLVRSPAFISEHVNNDKQPILEGMWLIQWKDKFVPWRKINDPYKEFALSSRGNVVIRVTHPESGWERIFTSATEAADATGCSPTNLQWRLKDKDAGKKVYSNGYTYQYYLDYIGVSRDASA